MKVAILAGGFGTRLAEETEIRPKPMVEIGGKPMLWHIMKIYAHYGFKDFVIALGYKGEYIKKYIVDYCSLTNNMTVNMKNGQIERHDCSDLDWTVQLIDTGLKTMTGGLHGNDPPRRGRQAGCGGICRGPQRDVHTQGIRNLGSDLRTL